MVSAETSVDESVFHRLWVEHCRLTSISFERECLCRGMIRSFLAEVGIVRPANIRRKPQPSVLVEHRIVIVGTRIPDCLIAPVRRWSIRLRHGTEMNWWPQRRGHVGIAHR